jgi:hypothetical protein
MQIDPVDFDYSQSAIIKPPFEQPKNLHDTRKKITRVVIDSRDRNSLIFPTPAQYEVMLQDDIDEVTSVELCMAQVPMMAYNVSQYYNTIVITGTQYTIPVGNYDGASLATTLSNLIGLTVTYNAIADNLTFTSTNPFTIGGTGTINKMLGFSSGKDYSTSGSTYVITAPYRVNLLDNRYVVLNIEQVTLNNSINPVLHKSFALLSPKMQDLNFIETQCKTIKYLNPPIARLHKVRLTFRDYYGNLYDFQNHDHRIELVFESRKHLLRYQQ